MLREFFVTKIKTIFQGKYIGSDEFGNRYYQEKNPPKCRRPKRWVVYNGVAEASKVTAFWHGWLHHTHGEHRTSLPNAISLPHMVNLTGKIPAAPKEAAPMKRKYTPWQP